MTHETLNTLKARAKQAGLIYETSVNSNLSGYELSCGCIEYAQVKESNGEPLRSTLWKEYGVYQVRIHDFETGIRQQWHSYRTLTEARKAFNRSKRAIINFKLQEKEQ